MNSIIIGSFGVNVLPIYGRRLRGKHFFHSILQSTSNCKAGCREFVLARTYLIICRQLNGEADCRLLDYEKLFLYLNLTVYGRL